MKYFSIREICILVSLLFILSFFTACGTTSNQNTSGSRTRGATGNVILSDEENSQLDIYERAKKAEGHRNLGNAYLESGRHNMALAEFKSALKLIPNDYELMYDIGLVYLFWSRPDEAIPYFEDVLALKPNYAPALNSLGNAYLGIKDYDRAISYYEQINDEMIYATPYMPLANTGLAYFYKGDYAKAESYYKQALKIEPDYINALVLLGQLQTETGDTKSALKNLQKALRIQDAPIIKYYLACAYLKSGDRAMATKYFSDTMSSSKEDSDLYELAAAGLRQASIQSDSFME